MNEDIEPPGHSKDELIMMDLNDENERLEAENAGMKKILDWMASDKAWDDDYYEGITFQPMDYEFWTSNIQEWVQAELKKLKK